MEPKAFEYFAHADHDLKESFYKKDPEGAVKSLDELVGFVGEICIEDWPGTKRQVCKYVDEHKDNKWDDFKRIGGEMRNKDTALHTEDKKLFFNKKDISDDAKLIAEDYIREDWERLGYQFGATLNKASQNGDDLFLF